MRKTKKIIFLILIAAIVLGLLMSCGDKTSENKDNKNDDKDDQENQDKNNGSNSSGDGSQNGETGENDGGPRINPALPDEDFGG
ncbi:MAG: hypothetical protein FWG20_03795, partial [Candidatus Cloacimonetes bacterium]|nr:hypothetical protein [Candidatus Cloacimonadota bacterium]